MAERGLRLDHSYHRTLGTAVCPGTAQKSSALDPPTQSVLEGRIHDLLLPDPPAELIVQVGKHWRKVRS